MTNSPTLNLLGGPTKSSSTPPPTPKTPPNSPPFFVLLSTLSPQRSTVFAWYDLMRYGTACDGQLTEANVNKYVTNTFGKMNSIAEKLILMIKDHARQAVDDANLTEPQAAAARARRQKEAFDYFEQELAKCNQRMELCRAREAQVDLVGLQAAVLPNAKILEKIRRYETHLNRQLLRALSTLQQLQKSRPTAPPQKLQNKPSEPEKDGVLWQEGTGRDTAFC